MTTVGLSSAAVISLSWLIESIIKEIDDEDALHPSSIFFIKSDQPVLVLYVLFKNLISLSFFAVLCCTI